MNSYINRYCFDKSVYQISISATSVYEENKQKLLVDRATAAKKYALPCLKGDIKVALSIRRGY